MKLTILSLLLSTLSLLVSAADTPTARPPFLGVFSNETDGFNIKVLMLDGNGKGYYFAAVAGVPVLWKHNPSTNEITLTGPIGVNLKSESFVVRFDLSRREFTILDPKRAEGSRPLHHISDEIPQRIREGIKDFDGTLNRP